MYKRCKVIVVMCCTPTYSGMFASDTTQCVLVAVSVVAASQCMPLHGVSPNVLLFCLFLIVPQFLKTNDTQQMTHHTHIIITTADTCSQIYDDDIIIVISACSRKCSRLGWFWGIHPSITRYAVDAGQSMSLWEQRHPLSHVVCALTSLLYCCSKYLQFTLR